jgi:hypothetical protein
MLNQETAIEEGNRIIALFHGWKHSPTPKNKGKGYWSFPEWGKAHWGNDFFEYHYSWDWLMPAWKKCTDIGLFMMTNGFDRLWLEKEKEIEDAIVREVDCKKAAILISMLIKWYNTQSKNTEP